MDITLTISESQRLATARLLGRKDMSHDEKFTALTEARTLVENMFSLLGFTEQWSVEIEEKATAAEYRREARRLLANVHKGMNKTVNATTLLAVVSNLNSALAVLGCKATEDI